MVPGLRITGAHVSRSNVVHDSFYFCYTTTMFTNRQDIIDSIDPHNTTNDVREWIRRTRQTVVNPLKNRPKRILPALRATRDVSNISVLHHTANLHAQNALTVHLIHFFCPHRKEMSVRFLMQYFTPLIDNMFRGKLQ